MSMNETIKDFWENESDCYRSCVEDELEGFKKDEWKSILRRVIEVDTSPKVLDIGTGPGFFATLLHEMSCDVTAIDITNNMIKVAKDLCAEKDNITFMTMDSHETTFEDNSFDFLVCRNVTWTLDNPSKAYKEWLRILKPRGKLIIFDANFNLRHFDADVEKTYQDNLQTARDKGYVIEAHNDEELEDKISKTLFLSDKVRPQWDLNTMLNLGFKEFYVDTNFDDSILTEQDKLLWGYAPSFMIVATK